MDVVSFYYNVVFARLTNCNLTHRVDSPSPANKKGGGFLTRPQIRPDEDSGVTRSSLALLCIVSLVGVAAKQAAAEEANGAFLQLPRTVLRQCEG